MRGEQSRLQSAAQEEEEEEEEDRTTTFITNGKSGHHTDTTVASGAQRPSSAPAVSLTLINQQQPDGHTCSSCQTKSFVCSVTHPPPPVDGSSKSTSSHLFQPSLAQNELRLSSRLAPQSQPEDSFNSSFSFIQQSLTSGQNTGAITTPAQEQQLNLSTKAPQAKPETLFVEHGCSKQPSPAHTFPAEELSSGGRFWQECLFADREEASHLPDCESQSVDIEVTSSLSVDWDTASASSVTSGYESATPASEQGWDNLLKKYEGVLQDCLQSNRTHTKVRRTLTLIHFLHIVYISFTYRSSDLST